MLLAADIGNSHTVLGLLDDEGAVVHDWLVATDDRATADQWMALLRGLLGEREALVDGVAVCATVPAVQREWRTLLARYFDHVPVVVVGPGVRTGLPLRVDNPREVGADRIVNALAAAASYPAPVVVVDLGGTATTLDVVDAAGAYIGGVIAPGIEVASAALGQGGAQLRQVELVRPPTVIGRNTVEALQSGATYGVAAQVEGLVDRVVDELGVGADEVRVVATGYLAPLVLDACRCFTDHAPRLTLEGLFLVHAKNAGSG